MKKSIKTLALGLLTVSMLTGCKKAPDPTWSDEVKEMMTQNLHGVILPYLSLSNMEATVDEGMINVVADELDGSALAAYAEKFTVEEGWVNMLQEPSSSASSFLGEEPAYPDHYHFEKEVMVPGEQEGEQVKRFVDVLFGNQNGEFVAQAGDPYEYEFPAYDLMYEVYMMTGGQVVTSFPEPAFTVDAYAYNPKYGVYFTKNASVDHPADSYHGTISAFEKEGEKVYIVDEGEEEHSYVAYDETQMYVFNFSEEDGEMVFGIGNFTDWPSIALANLLKEHFGELQDSVPACASDKFKTVFAFDDDISVKLEVLLPENLTIAAAEEAYANLLLDEEVGYKAASLGGHEGYQSENDELFIYFSDYTEEEEPYTDRFVINILDAKAGEWPQAKIDAFKAIYGMKTAIPAYANPLAIFTFEDHIKDYDLVIVNVHGVGKDFSAYANLLTTDDLYTLIQSTEERKVYRSTLRPDTQIALIPDEDINGFSIYIWGLEVDSSFPVAKLAAEFSVEASIFPTPELTGADFWVYSSYYAGEKVITTGYFDTADHAAAAVETLSDAYEADTENWMMLGVGQFAKVGDDEFTVSISVDSDDTKQVSFVVNKVIHYTSLPALKLLNRVGLNVPEAYLPYFLPAPSFEANDWVIESPYSNQSRAVTEFETAEEAAAAVTAYIAQIQATGTYTYNSEKGYWEYQGSNFTLVVMPTSSGTSFSIIVALF